MNSLPIVTRELRVASRLRSTFWVRVAAAITGLIIGSGCLVLTHWQGSTSQLGSFLFEALTWICLVAALAAGLFFTSDCLSEEKRDGTLGLLFLTDLRGYDIVLGKLLVTSLRGFYALLAVLPILALTQLMGGVTGAQYWKSSLALVNALFCSLAAGLLISAISRDSQKAMAATLLVLLLLAIGGPIADVTIAAIKKRGFQPLGCLTSPAYLLRTAGAWGRAPYWDTLLVTEGLAWLMLGAACGLTPHTWQERPSGDAGNNRGWSYQWKYGSFRRRRRLRTKLLERQPMTWLACRERWQSLTLWILALLITGTFLATVKRTAPTGVWIMWNYLGGLFVVLLYLWMASQAVRFFIEARRSGLTELLLVTPLSERQIVNGQWRGLLRMFGIPLLLLLSLQVAGAVLSQVSWHRIAKQVSTATMTGATNQAATSSNQVVVSSFSVAVGSSNGVTIASGTNSAAVPSWNPAGSTRQELALVTTVGAATALATAGNLLALCWFGLWMGLTSKSANLGTLKTILFVQVIPWFIIAFGGTIVLSMVMAGLSFSGQAGSWFVWWPVLSAGLGATLAVGKDIGFIIWSRRKLFSSFRDKVAQVPGYSQLIVPPPLPAIAKP